MTSMATHLAAVGSQEKTSLVNPHQDTRALESKLKELEKALERQEKSHKRASLSVLIVSAVIILVILGFSSANYAHFKSEWTRDKIAKNLELELEELNPIAMEELGKLGEALMPVYAAEARRQFDRLGPKISARLSEQLDKLSEDLRKDTHERLAEMENRIRTKTEKIVFDCYPDLSDPAGRAELNSAFREITESALSKAITDFDSRFSKDVKELRAAVMKFDVGPTNETTLDLQKKFISLWLKQLDQEIQKL